MTRPRALHLRRPLAFSVLLGLVLLLLSGCQAIAKGDLVSADWSRAISIGTSSLNAQVASSLDQSGQSTCLVWIASPGEGRNPVLHYARLSRDGTILTERDLAIGAESPSETQLVVDDEGVVHLAWLDRLEDDRRLFYARLDLTGRLLSAPQTLSPEELTVSRFDMGMSAPNAIEIFWGSREGQQAGLYHLRMGTNGEVLAENRHLGRQGFDPCFRVDTSGNLHLVWVEEPEYGQNHLYYAPFDADTRTLQEPHELAAFAVGGGLIGHPPTLGLTDTDAYVFWSLERRGGGVSQPGAGTQWVSFPLGQPQQAGKPAAVTITAENHPAMAGAVGTFHLTQLAGLSGANANGASAFVYMPSTPREAHDVLVVALSVQIDSRTRSIVQPTVTLWQDGRLTGYQIAASTRGSSLRPVLLVDGDEHLLLTWIDTAGAGSYAVYVAGTAPEAIARLNRFTWEDAALVAVDRLWGVTQALGFVPLALIWVVPSLMLLGVYAFISAEGDLARRGSRIALVCSLVLYVAVKYLFRPNWLMALPLPRNTPTDLATVLIFAVPLVISGLAVLITWRYIHKRQYADMFPAFGVFVASDALLTLLIYVPGMLAE
ncbi:MAG: hypothetical protein ACYC4R_12710 [Anaerolineae bacterium]